MGNPAKPCEATGLRWVMRGYVELLAIYPVAAHRSSDCEHPGARAAAVQTSSTVAPASRKQANGFIAGRRRGAAGQGVSSSDTRGKVGAARTVVFSLRCCLPSINVRPACTQSKREVMETA